MDVLAPFIELWNTPGVKENLEESARLYFSQGGVTVNLIPAAIIILLGVFLLKPLLGIPLLSQIFGAMTGSGASYGTNLEVSDGYGAPASSYGAPAPSYGAPAPAYGAPAPAYDTPTDSYSATGRRRREAHLPEDVKNLWEELKQHQDMVGENMGDMAHVSLLQTKDGTLDTSLGLLN